MKKIIWISLIILIPNIIMAINIKLSIDDAVEMGLKNDKLIKISKKNINIDEKKYKKSKSEFFPKISIKSSYMKTDQKDKYGFLNPITSEEMVIFPEMDEQIKNTLSLNQVIFTGFALKNKIKIDKNERNISKSMYKNNKSELVYQIHNIYWSIYKLENRGSVIHKSLENMKLHLRDVKNYYIEGMATKADILKVKEKISQVELKKIENDNNVKKSKIKLKLILGLDLEDKIEIVSKLKNKNSVEKFQLNNCVSKGLKNREELKQIKLKKKISDLAVKISKSNFSPKIFLVGNYHFDKPNSSIQPVENEFQDSWEVGVNFSFDIFNGGERFHDLAEKKIVKEKINLIYEKSIDNIKNQIISSYFDYKKEIKSMEYVEKNYEEANENYRITKNLYKEGMIKSSELLDSEIILMESKIRRLNAIVDMHLAKLNLKKSMGELNL